MCRVLAALGLACVLLAAAEAGGADAATLDFFDEGYNDPGPPFFTPHCNARLQGEIRGPVLTAPEGSPARLGDAARMTSEVAAFLAEQEAAHGKPVGGHFLALCLFSNGGDLAEGTRLAAMFEGWMMVVEDRAECLSACAILFMSAPASNRVTMYAADNPGRYLHYRGMLGFHSPRLNFPESQACHAVGRPVANEKDCMLAPAEASLLATRAYANALASIKAIAVPAKEASGSDLPVAAHQDAEWTFVDRVTIPFSRELPTDLLLAFLTVPPEKFFYITRLEEALSWGIELYGVPPTPVLTEAMLKSACINIASRRCALSSGGECSERNIKSLAARMAKLGISNEGDIEARLADFKSRLSAVMTKPVCELVNVPNCQTLSAAEQEQLRLGKLKELQDEALNFKQVAFEGARLLGPYAVGVTLGGKRLDRKDLAPLKSKKLSLWPPDGQVVQSAGQVTYSTAAIEVGLDGTPVCDVQGVWARVPSGELLIRLRIDAGALELGAARPLVAAVDPTTAHEAQSPRYILKPWMMLPAGTRLSEIGPANPWGWTGEGEDFFDRPANWYRP